jgi:dihydrodipicolinate synthase/N-acetylneuraminate lyase
MGPTVLATLRQGVAIPAMPLALNAQRKLDERRQRALCRYYIAAGAGGIAAAVHTTQFGIRDPKVALFKPVLEIVVEEFTRAGKDGAAEAVPPKVLIGGVCGATPQATAEATALRDLGYHAGLLSLAALKTATEDELIAHCRAIADIIPVVGFYLQPAVGGRLLPYSFWRRFAEIENVVAIKMAPFNRYQTLDVVRAIAESGREDIALYTGNDDNIVADLLTPYRFTINSKYVWRRIVGGLLGHYAVWTKTSVEILHGCHRAMDDMLRMDAHCTGGMMQAMDLGDLISVGVQVTDSNAAFFDAANGFAGCIAGLHEILRRQGLLEGIWCLDEREGLSPGQAEELTRVTRAYPHLCDDAFVAEHRDAWLR